MLSRLTFCVNSLTPHASKNKRHKSYFFTHVVTAALNSSKVLTDGKLHWTLAQSRRHVGAFRGLAPQQSSKHPPTSNMKYYKSVEFWQFLECQAPPHNILRNLTYKVLHIFFE